MGIKFVKLQAFGNDYIFIDAFHQEIADPAKLSIAVSDRHFGIGADGMVMVCPSDVADVRMRIFDPDGTEAEMCGNAVRGTAKFAYEQGLCKKDVITVETLGGIKAITLHFEDDVISTITANIGKPGLEPNQVPVITEEKMFFRQPIKVLDKTFLASSLSWGNPHTLIEVTDLDNLDIEKYGPAIEHLDIFPERTNVTFGMVVDRQRLAIREWERGCVETIGCGTGCCTALVFYSMMDLCDREVDIKQIGGVLHAKWDEADDMIMTGWSHVVCEGEFIGEA